LSLKESVALRRDTINEGAREEQGKELREIIKILGGN
jgi:hypothetical protein